MFKTTTKVTEERTVTVAEELVREMIEAIAEDRTLATIALTQIIHHNPTDAPQHVVSLCFQDVLEALDGNNPQILREYVLDNYPGEALEYLDAVPRNPVVAQYLKDRYEDFSAWLHKNHFSVYAKGLIEVLE